ncbi:sodium-dependent transporter [Xiamenia xianingshaonis]|uniref:Transporter n=1 Tax=Xiamenia xianingshaonis TaxID=2682776 RepID=A0A9E6MRH5_9ACTN|nr:sodium-dependent transporter [Xiamenia xianingshaonis]NGM17572.1 sodium-dependent transporter [Eggerthellaceae bacterium zg-893]NHM13241.1 sodium-dependent transporter [Xiamenia xianingshaonis]NHM15387.1 sodium-dependent transporter [Xiamenia xianingshaonis]QTU84672.1 sodium-dependent transporter [Xiamenia xianingshaonis]
MATEGAKPARAAWSSKWAFILAAAASAIGLGNLWRFPYLAAKYGGGAFLLVYILLVVTFGFTLMMAETALGRKTGQSAIGAFRSFGRKYIFIGVLASAVPFIITPYYALIGGWVTKFMAAYLFEGASAIAADGYFTNFILNNGETYIWMYVFLAVVIVVVALGVKNGIERVNKVLMVALLAIAVGISIFSLTLPGALDGLAYYLIPDFTKFSVEMVVAAMGQMFFSLSLAMGIMITYGSYFRQDEDLEHSVRRIELFDTGIAILAGLMIIPAAVAVQGSAEAVATNAGPGFMFGVLPQVFQGMGFAANAVGFVFFALVFFAALTSCISLFETLVSIVADGAHVSRGLSIAVCSVFVVLIGTLVNMGYNNLLDVDLMYTVFHIGEPGNAQILDFFDFVSNTVLMPIVALLTCIFVGWIIKPQVIIDEVEKSGEFNGQKLFVVMIKYIAPVFVVCILVAYVMNALGIIVL